MYPEVESAPAPLHKINCMQDFFSRIDSSLSLPALLDTVAGEFSLGTTLKYVPILTGYQDCNIDLETTEGKYVVKIFSREKSKERIDDIIWAYTSAAKLGIPVPKLLGVSHSVRACIFHYFEGKPLTRTPGTDTDFITLTNGMAKIHTMTRSIRHYYDTMGIVNVSEEYAKKNAALSTEEQSTIIPIINKFHKIKLATFPQSIIHGTFEKENVLKNQDGTLCLLDFGSMDFNASILDIATFIANFTQYADPIKRNHIIHLILETYQKSRPLTPPELTALPTLIRSQHAAYVINMSYHMRIEHDMTKQTQSWLDRGWDGLRAYEKVSRII